jgi:hypothetical protein
MRCSTQGSKSSVMNWYYRGGHHCLHIDQ